MVQTVGDKDKNHEPIGVGYLKTFMVAALAQGRPRADPRQTARALDGLQELNLSGFRIHFDGDRVGSKMVALSLIDGVAGCASSGCIRGATVLSYASHRFLILASHHAFVTPASPFQAPAATPVA